MRRWLGRQWAQRLGWVGLFLLIWQGAAASGAVSPLLLPPLEAVGAELVHALQSGHLLEQIGFSLLLLTEGLLLAALFALVLAYGALHSKILRSLTDALCMLAHPLPAIALLPLIIVWFGIGAQAILVIIIHSALWPLLLNLLAGFGTVPRVYVESGKSLSMGPLRLLWGVYLPASAPHLLSGAKTAWARAWRALISAEMLFGAVGAYGGIGWYLFKSRVLMNTPGLYAGILVVILTGMGVEGMLEWAERRSVRRWGEA
ncbi:MAG: ABC transporter permease subunit [Candidatus Limiplasma sp.]|nr:ABC transporter permease subunit [Candidatus Limiplasma sp.]